MRGQLALDDCQCWWHLLHEDEIARVVDLGLDAEQIDDLVSFAFMLRVARGKNTWRIQLRLVDVEFTVAKGDFTGACLWEAMQGERLTEHE